MEDGWGEVCGGWEDEVMKVSVSQQARTNILATDMQAGEAAMCVESPNSLLICTAGLGRRLWYFPAEDTIYGAVDVLGLSVTVLPKGTTLTITA